MRKIDELFKLLNDIERKRHMANVISYDMETAAPKGGMSYDSSDLNYLSNEIFVVEKSDRYINLIREIYADQKDLDVFEKRLISNLYKSVKDNERVSPELNDKESKIFSDAYITWLNSKENNSYAMYKDTLKSVYEVQKEVLSLREGAREDNLYDILFCDYEEGFTSADLDKFFNDLEAGIVPLYKKVRESTYVPRHDFLTRKVDISKQEKFTDFILKFNQFDTNRGSISTTEHPFTSAFGQNDVRVTTHYFETNFISNMYSIIHEGGHAIFGQNLPDEVFSSHLGESAISMGKHESVSRFYENIIGRSKEYIHAIYPTFKELFKEEMSDISIDDFYEGVNYVDLNNSIRTEADELSYSLHILLRYKLEREIMSGKVDFNTLSEKWNQLTKELLLIDNKDDKTGILQDVHWSSGFGYFPTYALGNALNCMYVKKMKKDLDFSKTISDGRMDIVLSWMKENVFKKATILNTKEWIKDITGEDFSAKDYIEYLTGKYSKIYHL